MKCSIITHQLKSSSVDLWVVPSYVGVAWDPSWEEGIHPAAEVGGLVHTEGPASMGVKIFSIHHPAESME